MAVFKTISRTACSLGQWIDALLKRHRALSPRLVLAPRHDVQWGQTLVEFSLVVSFLFLILFGIIDFSRLFFAYATMANGVREGARYAVVHPGQDTAIIDHSESMMVLIGGEASVVVSYPDTIDNEVCLRRPCRVIVTATSDFDVWTPIIPALTIVAQSTMHIE